MKIVVSYSQNYYSQKYQIEQQIDFKLNAETAFYNFFNNRINIKRTDRIETKLVKNGLMFLWMNYFAENDL